MTASITGLKAAAGRRLLACALAALVGTGAAAAQAPDTPSGPLARELVKLMADKKLETIALQDPDAPGRFVAVMVQPGVQLLAVAARHGSPDYLEWQLGQKQFRDVYIALQTGAVAESKVFFQDLGADGLHGRAGESVDVMYERGTEQTLFNGDWRQSGRSRAEYEKKLRDAEKEYSRLLTLAIASVKAAAAKESE